MRFFYVVRPSLDRWEVSFGENGSCFVYSGMDEALAVATGAAKLHWESQRAPSGVRLELPNAPPREIATFGTTRLEADAAGARPGRPSEHS
jgi:hypothetical protein